MTALDATRQEAADARWRLRRAMDTLESAVRAGRTLLDGDAPMDAMRITRAAVAVQDLAAISAALDAAEAEAAGKALTTWVPTRTRWA